MDRADGVAMIKRESGDETVETARAALVRQHRRWLNEVGAAGPAEAGRLEISPCFALDPEELKLKLAKGFRYEDGLLLDGSTA
jgi:hypothetical protein